MLSIKSVADVLNTTVSAVRKAIKKGNVLPSCYGKGNTLYYNSSAIDQIKAAL
jgi:hypothetical protein